jgi:hypothetical protein
MNMSPAAVERLNRGIQLEAKTPQPRDLGADTRLCCPLRCGRHPNGTGALKKPDRKPSANPAEDGVKMAFRVLIIGGTGQVGAAVMRALAAEPSCAEVVMLNRRAISLTADPRVRQVILDTAAAQFPAEVTKLAQSMVSQGDPVYGASCVGVGKGSMKWSEEELKALEICVVSALGSGRHREKQISLCAGHGVKRRDSSRDRLPTPRHFSSGNYRRECSHAALCSLVGASYSGTFWHD